jgi:two-component system, cell cycle sensor histidine kinase and response regulator CckA
MNDKSFESLESGRKTVLVVDDDPSILLVIQAMLESQDLRVLLANNAESALRLGEQSQLTIDLLLADVVMPDVSGPDLALRMLSLRPNLRVLFMSAFADVDIVRVKVLDKALGFVAKPFSSDSLLANVREALVVPTWPSVTPRASTASSGI